MRIELLHPALPKRLRNSGRELGRDRFVRSLARGKPLVEHDVPRDATVATPPFERRVEAPAGRPWRRRSCVKGFLSGFGHGICHDSALYGCAMD